MTKTGNSSSAAILDEARSVVRALLAGQMAPLYYFLELESEEQVQRRAKPLPYLAAGTHLLELIGAKTIVEIGAMRAPMLHGVYEFSPSCCNDGHSTAIWAYTGLEVHSVDINPVCRDVASTLLENNPNLHCYTEDGIAFLDRFTQQIDLLYLDAWDVHMGHDYAERHLAAYLAGYDKLAPTCIVQIDDTDIYFGGKGELVVPRLIRDGFELLITGRQTILIRVAD